MEAAIAFLFAQQPIAIPQQLPAPNEAVSPVPAVISLVLVIAALAGMWKVFEKAGQPGWGILIPFYNLYLLVKVAGRPGWWFLLFFIPLVNLILFAVITMDIARNFGKGILFGLGLFFFGFIFYPILGFGDARYQPLNRPSSNAM